jgi:acyl-coenzyme A thioesterase PaaI-like protein
VNPVNPTFSIPYATALGLVVESDGHGAICRMRYTESLAGFGALHGGAIGALLELAAIAELSHGIVGHRSIGDGSGESKPKLISMTVEFLRAGRLEDTFAWAHIVRQGRRVANVRAEAWQGERTRLIAVAHSVFSLS